MRRLLTFAAFLLIISVVPVYAQHGGGGSHGGGGGSHGGFSGGHGSSGGHATVMGHSSGGFVGARAGVAGGSHFGPAGHAGYGYRGFRGNRYGFGYGFRNRWGYGYPYYGYPYYGYYDPYWWWDSGSSYDDDQAQQQQMAGQMNEENLEEQQMLQQQDQDAYAQRRPVPRDPQPSRQETARNDPATVLVFRNGSQREIQNYAIVDGMLFNFTAARTERIPLAVLDIPATVKANDDRGVDFRLPGTGEGQ
ncbi:MAG: hypothetical protein WCC04_12500 [Terriglobales bacterium]